MRRDAVQNRERLLAAARELFAEQGFEVTLDDIARHAGVGVGTAYRRFANKGELLDALFAEQTVELAAAADAGVSSDVVEGDVEALFSEELAGGGQQPVPVLHSVSA